MEKGKEMENLKKSVDELIDFLLTEDSVEEVEKSIDIAKDAETTADQAVKKAPKAQMDNSRGAGRPKQISDVPASDTDGQRAKEYDASITMNENKEDEPEEAKKQAKVMDQSKDDMRMKQEGQAPKVRPFVKSESGSNEISEEEYNEFLAFKKSQEEAKAAETLRKSEEMQKANTEQLVKAAVEAQTEELRKSFEELKAINEEQATMIKSLRSTPVRAKSVTGIEQLEKSNDPELREAKTYSSKEIGDKLMELHLAKSHGITESHVVEYDTTGTIYDARIRSIVEKELNK